MKFEWNENINKEFNDHKKELSKALSLAILDYKRKFVVKVHT